MKNIYIESLETFISWVFELCRIRRPPPNNIQSITLSYPSSLYFDCEGKPSFIEMPKAPKKKHFHGTSFVHPQIPAQVPADHEEVPQMQPAPAPLPDPPAPLTASQSKIRDEVFDEPVDGGNRLVDLGNLLDFMQTTPCAQCLVQEGFDVKERKRGLASVLSFRCKRCHFERGLHTSKEHQHEGTSYAETNTRVVAGTLAIGKNYKTISKFIAYLNLPQLISYRFWQKHVAVLDEVYQEAAEASMMQAADEERVRGQVPRPEGRVDDVQQVQDVQNVEEVQDVMTSCDGTWHRRGFSSHHGVCTVLTGNGKKVIDVDVKSSYCNLCMRQKKNLHPAQFTLWQQKHQAQEMCEQNHTGSAGAMEPLGMLSIFRRSIDKRRLRYVHFLGDGDSKTFKAVSEADPPVYPGVAIQKLECTGHVQKRVKNKFTTRISQCSSMEFTNDLGKKVKGIGGRNGLTEWHIRRIQGHYGAAIRNNAGNLQQMTDAVWAIYWHRRGDHTKCGIDCPAVSTGDLVKANVHRLPTYVMNELLPAFEQLAHRSLLEKCVHGGTQNSNEAFHHLIWERCPKTVFANLRRLRIAVSDAIVSFNEGDLAALNILKRLGFANVGTAARAWAHRSNKRRLLISLVQSANPTKSSRKRKASKKVLEAAKKRKQEGTVYQAGGGFE